MQRATISVSEGRFPEAHFGNRRIMEPSIGYALTRLSAHARSLGTGITVEVDDKGTRLSLTIDAEGRLHTPPGANALAGAPTEARSDSSAPTQTLPVTPEGASTPQQPQNPRDHGDPRDHRRTFAPAWNPASALPSPSHQPRPHAESGGPESDSAAPVPPRDGCGSTREHSNRAVAPRPVQARPVRAGIITTLIVAALALCGAGLLLL